MDFVVAVHVRHSHIGRLSQQHLRHIIIAVCRKHTVRNRSNSGRSKPVVEGSEADGVTVIRRRPELQQCLHVLNGRQKGSFMHGSLNKLLDLLGIYLHTCPSEFLKSKWAPPPTRATMTDRLLGTPAASVKGVSPWDDITVDQNLTYLRIVEIRVETRRAQLLHFLRVLRLHIVHKLFECALNISVRTLRWFDIPWCVNS